MGRQVTDSGTGEGPVEVELRAGLPFPVAQTHPLNRLRLRDGLSFEDVQQKFEGWDLPVIEQVHLGVRQPTPMLLLALAELYRVNARRLFTACELWRIMVRHQTKQRGPKPNSPKQYALRLWRRHSPCLNLRLTRCLTRQDVALHLGPPIEVFDVSFQEQMVHAARGPGIRRARRKGVSQRMIVRKEWQIWHNPSVWRRYCRLLNVRPASLWLAHRRWVESKPGQGVDWLKEEHERLRKVLEGRPCVDVLSMWSKDGGEEQAFPSVDSLACWSVVAPVQSTDPL